MIEKSRRVMMVARARMTWTVRWVCILDCAEEVEGSGRSRRGETDGRDHCERIWGKLKTVGRSLRIVYCRDNG